MIEPQHITMARQVLAQDGIDSDCELYRSAELLIKAHDRELTELVERKEQHELDKVETAKRWPDIARLSFVYDPKEHEFYRGPTDYRHDRLECSAGTVLFENDDGSIMRDTDLVVALLDATNNNTTAERLREAMHACLDELTSANDAFDSCVEIGKIIERALAASNV